MKIRTILVAAFVVLLVFSTHISLTALGAGDDTINATHSYHIRGELGREAYFGQSMERVGDINGDGHQDLLVGAPNTPDDTVESVGRAYLFLGSDTGVEKTYSWSSWGDRLEDAYFGICVAGAGDVNKDGFDDVIIGAYGQGNATVASHGKAFLFLGEKSGLSDTPAWMSTGDTLKNAYFGSSVSGAGDVNGDGYDDVIIGAYKQNVGGTLKGKAFLFLGKPSGLSTDYLWNFTSQSYDDDYLGGEVAGIGDVNKDGNDDVAVGCVEGILVP